MKRKIVNSYNNTGAKNLLDFYRKIIFTNIDECCLKKNQFSN